jgi:hypothetical protein
MKQTPAVGCAPGAATGFLAVATFTAADEGKSDQIMLAQKMPPMRWEGVVFQRP